MGDGCFHGREYNKSYTTCQAADDDCDFEMVKSPNGLALSCAASIDWEDGRTDSSFQNGDDLAPAQRRQLQRRVGRQLVGKLQKEGYDGFMRLYCCR